jgi:uncharacterized protein (DUF1684 family)
MIATLIATYLLGPYEAGELKFRQELESSLKSKRGWLTVAGLFWLDEGESSVGSDPSCVVKLPDSAPKKYGTLIRKGNNVSMRLADGSEKSLKSDAQGGMDEVKVGDATFMIIQRGARIGVRLYDPHSKARQEFKGLKWFPVNSKYRVEAKFVPYAKPQTLLITNVLGDVSPVPSPGYVTFKLGGKQLTLAAQDEGPNYFFNFTDLTTGKETYGAGRFLYSPKQKDGRVILDFNRAINPPCAFTAFATCPLPPKGNQLAVRVPAGELAHHPVK